MNLKAQKDPEIIPTDSCRGGRSEDIFSMRHALQTPFLCHVSVQSKISMLGKGREREEEQGSTILRNDTTES